MAQLGEPLARVLQDINRLEDGEPCVHASPARKQGCRVRSRSHACGVEDACAPKLDRKPCLLDGACTPVGGRRHCVDHQLEGGSCAGVKVIRHAHGRQGIGGLRCRRDGGVRGPLPAQPVVGHAVGGVGDDGVFDLYSMQNLLTYRAWHVLRWHGTSWSTLTPYDIICSRVCSL